MTILVQQSTTSNPFEEEAAFVIWISGSTIYARNGSTGNLLTSGTDATTVINAALNALTAGRSWKEKIIVKGGTYSLTDTITVPSYAILDMSQAKITVPNGFMPVTTTKGLVTATSQTDVEIYIGQIDFNGTHQPNMSAAYQMIGIMIDRTIRFKVGIGYAYNGLRAGGDSGGQIIGIEITYLAQTDCQGEISFINALNLQFGAVYLVKVKNLLINCGNLTNMVDAFYMDTCYNISTFGGKIEGCIDNGTDIENSQAIFFLGTKSINNYAGTLGDVTTGASASWGVGASVASEVYLIGCSAVIQNSAGSANDPLQLGTQAGNSLHLTNCYLEGDGTGNAYITRGSPQGTIYFSNCRFKSLTGCNFNGSGGTYVYIIGGSFSSVTNIFNTFGGGINKLVIHNVDGFITENWGTDTGTGVQQNVAHGLSATPSLVVICEYTTGLAIPYQSAAADATNLKIIATLNKTFTWYARV